MIVIVSGLPRCGTSMMMQMLAAGGLPVLTDALRGPNEDNPRGYYELEKVKRIKTDVSWLAEAEGKAFKMVSMLLYDLPPDRAYKVIFMLRDMDEILASQAEMLRRSGQHGQGPADAEMRQYFDAHLEKLRAWLASRANMETLYCRHRDVLGSPAEQAARISAFLGVKMDESKMVAAVDPSLYRQRKARG